ncbi:MAG: HAD hydrolase-like protein, partial [Neisseriaceae bacterium]|nr:HAD hydrolase-like protein [Neisseriaceae bacterium]
MKSYRALIFDWDGTLADSTAHIVDAVQFAFEQNGLQPPSVDDARSIIGFSLENAMLQLC